MAVNELKTTILNLISYKKNKILLENGKLIQKAFLTADFFPFSGICPKTHDNKFAIIIPDNTNCSKFHICLGNHPVESECPANLIFNYELKVCDQPEAVTLGDKYCEFADMLYEKAHYCDCTKYVLCEFGNSTIYNCPDGFVWQSDQIRIISEPNNLSSVCQRGDCRTLG